MSTTKLTAKALLPTTTETASSTRVRAPYLHLIRGHYFYRRRVPTQYTWAFDDRDIHEVPLPDGLTASDLLKQVSQYNDAFERTLSVAQNRGAAGAVRRMREEDINVVAQAYEAQMAATDEEELAQAETDAEYEELVERAATALAQRKQARARGKTDELRDAALEFLEGTGLAPPTDEGLLRRLVAAIFDADQRAQVSALARYQGEVTSTPALPPSVGAYTGPGLSGERGYFDSMYDTWVKRTDASIKARYEAEVWLRRLAEFTQTDPTTFMTSLSQPHPVPKAVRGLRLHLRDMPRSRVVEFKDHWMDRAVRWEREGVGAKLSAKTVRKGLAMIGAVVGLSLHNYSDNDVPVANPFHHLWHTTERERGGRVKPRVAFSADEVNALLNSPLFVNGPDAYDPMEVSMYWCFLVCFYSGARLDEIAHLQPHDVTQSQGRWWVRIEAKSKSVRVKSLSSNRQFPVHPRLVEAGFVEYVKACRDQKWESLFPWLPRDKRGGVSAALSKRLNRYIDQQGLTSSRLTFHSTRHTFKHFCRELDIQTEVVDALCGHSDDKKSVSRGYGADEFPRAALIRAMDKFEIPELDLGHVLARAADAQSHVLNAMEAMARVHPKTGRVVRPGRLPAFLQRGNRATGAQEAR